VGDWISAHAVPDPEPNRAVLFGSGGHHATRDELNGYLDAHKATFEREALQCGQRETDDESPVFGTHVLLGAFEISISNRARTGRRPELRQGTADVYRLDR